VSAARAYLAARPKPGEIPAGQVMVHNSVRPTRKPDSAVSGHGYQRPPACRQSSPVIAIGRRNSGRTTASVWASLVTIDQGAERNLIGRPSGGSSMKNMKNSREDYLIAEALLTAIEAMSRLPKEFRPENNIAELKKMLDEMSPSNLAMLQWQARRYIDVLQGITPQTIPPSS
jgi:hypothetical protein